MAPHKPAIPLPRKVEVDLSGILIRPEELARAMSSHHTEFPNAFPAGWKDQSIGESLPRIGSSGWANIIFAMGSCLVGLFCTISILDNAEHFRRSAHLLADAAYLRPELIATASQRFALKTSRVAVKTQSARTELNLLEKNSTPSDPILPLSILPPFRPSTSSLSLSNSNFPLFANNVSGGSSSGGSGSGGSGEGSGSGGEGGNNRHTTSDRPQVRNPVRQARKSMLSSRSQVSRARKGFWARLVSEVSNSTGDKSPPRMTRSAGSSLKSGQHNGLQRNGAAQLTSHQSARSMHSMAGSVAGMQGRVTMNQMRMQNGMIAQPGLGGGLGGLNAAGLGGTGGGGNRGGNARR